MITWQSMKGTNEHGLDSPNFESFPELPSLRVSVIKWHERWRRATQKGLVASPSCHWLHLLGHQRDGWAAAGKLRKGSQAPSF